MEEVMKWNKHVFVFLLALVLIMCSCQKQTETEAASAVTPEVDSAISADGISIRYQAEGKGKTALVFIHGWCCDRNYWDAQVEAFAPEYKVVMIDLAGHGESGADRKDWTMTAFGEDVVAVVEKLGLERIVLIGHSMGGPVILEAARLMPGRVIGLVGADTFIDIEWEYTQEQMDQFLAPFRENFSDATQNFVRTMFTPTADPALVEKIVADMSAASQEVGMSAFEGMIDFIRNDVKQVFQEVKAPIRCINSDKNPTNIEGIRRYASSFDVVLMPGIGHFVMMEDPATFNSHLKEIVSKFENVETSE